MGLAFVPLKARPTLFPRRKFLLLQALGAFSSGGSAASKAEPGDFDFLSGEWRIQNRRLLPDGRWDEFPAEATVRPLLNGAASVEELRIPARQFAGLGIRLLDREAQVWKDFWVNAKNGQLSPPGMPGRFEHGVGLFEADEMDGDQPIKVRSVWDRITPTSCRWQQHVSRDGGQSWEMNWTMDWTRV